jgi:N-acetylmuramoyl-L-alanine amidase
MKISLLFPLALVAALSACTTQEVRNPQATWHRSPNQNDRGPVVIVLHHTDQDSVAESLHTLSTGNSGGPVSSHYLLGKDGDLYQLVADSQRAWHAGPGRWGPLGDLNSTSIGIEIDNDGDSAFPDGQIGALISLLDDLCTRLNIPRHAIIAHADLAPGRKQDPNVQFPWQTLAQAGFGLWPDPAHGPAPAGFDALLALRAFGYPVNRDKPEAAITAFHRRFRGDDQLPPVLDGEDARILHSLLLQLPGA